MSAKFANLKQLRSVLLPFQREFLRRQLGVISGGPILLFNDDRIECNGCDLQALVSSTGEAQGGFCLVPAGTVAWSTRTHGGRLRSVSGVGCPRLDCSYALRHCKTPEFALANSVFTRSLIRR